MLRDSQNISVLSIISSMINAIFAVAFVEYLIINLNDLREINSRILEAQDSNMKKEEVARKEQLDNLNRRIEDRMNQLDSKLDVLQGRNGM